MAFKVVLSDEGNHDLELIFEHLVESYMMFGDPLAAAFERAHQRIAAIEADMNALGLAPHQGTLLDQIRAGLRHVTKNQAIFYFEADDADRTVRILAIFFGGQDHRRRMLIRLSRI